MHFSGDIFTNSNYIWEQYIENVDETSNPNRNYNRMDKISKIPNCDQVASEEL